LRPVVRRQRLARRTAFTIDASDAWLFLARGGISAAGYERLVNAYPSAWIDLWKSRDGLHPFPEAVEAYVAWGETLAVTRESGLVPVSRLPAVASNYLAVAAKDGKVPIGPRSWYDIRLRPRHSAPIAVPRVISQDGRAHFNTGFVVDANFSTLTPDPYRLEARALLALLSSTWSRAVFEMAGTPLGGGALKLEATHLRSMPVPPLRPDQMRDLTELGNLLLTDTEDSVTERIDEIVFDAAAGSGAKVPASVLRSILEDERKVKAERRRAG